MAEGSEQNEGGEKDLKDQVEDEKDIMELEALDIKYGKDNFVSYKKLLKD